MLPFCRCGCKQRVLHAGRVWRAGCVPRSLRSEGAKHARANVAFRQRRARFRAEITAHLGEERSMTFERLLALCDAVYRRGFQSGHAACRSVYDRATERAANKSELLHAPSE
jgi:hypothetical protein